MIENKIIFITGTDTGVGKTVLTALLLRHLRAHGVRALAMKPFCSGGREDVRILQSLQKGELSDDEMNPFYFHAPVAPLVELNKAKKNIRLGDVIKKIHTIGKQCERLLVEGSGGLMVPLGKGYLVENLILKLNCPVVLVARNRLGTINHTLLTLARLQAKGIRKDRIKVVLMGGSVKDISTRTNESLLKSLLGGVELQSLPNLGKSWEKTLGKALSKPLSYKLETLLLGLQWPNY